MNLANGIRILRRTVTEHEVTACIPAWNEIAGGARTGEITKGDRGIRSGDVLVVKESGPGGVLTGRVCSRRITHVLSGGQTGPMGSPGLTAGYVLLSLAPVLSEGGTVDD